MNELPDPLTPADCDLQAFPFMPLQVMRLRDSDFAATVDPEACWYAVLLWATSWHQIPAASLPDDDAVLARHCGLGRDVRTFRKHKAGALQGFIKCADGRLYHPVVAEQALASWEGRETFKSKRSAAAERQARWREEQKAMSERLRGLGVTPPEKASKAVLHALLLKHDKRYAEERPVTSTGRHSVTPPVTPVTPKTGTGRETGKKEETPKPPERKPYDPSAGMPDDVKAVMEAGSFVSPPPDIALLNDWYAAGATLEQDILPVVRRVSSSLRKAPFKFKVFDAAVREKLAEDAADIDALQTTTRRLIAQSEAQH